MKFDEIVVGDLISAVEVVVLAVTAKGRLNDTLEDVIVVTDSLPALVKDCVDITFVDEGNVFRTKENPFVEDDGNVAGELN